ncbi:MAG: ribonuclease [Capsulimonas sp.]|jgi:ribonuclease-3|nr:ribonuclease [Capsulimonas sp.]
MTFSTEELRKEALARKLPITDMSKLRQALTHKSLVPEKPLDSNERLEFLGDSVLGLVINEYLYSAFPEKKEGELAKAKALIVCQSALAEAARRIDLVALLRIGRAEESTGGRNRSSLISDAFEAVVAVVYLERGYEPTRDFVISCLRFQIDAINRTSDWRDAKTALQEVRQARRLPGPVYRVADEQGMPHDRTFVVEVLLDNVVVGSGVGKSKREAEFAAADVALILLRDSGQIGSEWTRPQK